jgi:hypothetical protein
MKILRVHRTAAGIRDGSSSLQNEPSNRRTSQVSRRSSRESEIQVPGKLAEELSPILNNEAGHTLKLFAVAGYQSGPKAERLGRDEGIKPSNRRFRECEPHLAISFHNAVIDRNYVEGRDHLGEQMFVSCPEVWLTRRLMLDSVLQFAQGDDGDTDSSFAMSHQLVTYGR